MHPGENFCRVAHVDVKKVNCHFLGIFNHPCHKQITFFFKISYHVLRHC